MKVHYWSDVDPHYRCLENALASGLLGKLDNLELLNAEHSGRLYGEAHKQKFTKSLGLEAYERFVSEVLKDEIWLPTKFDYISSYHLISGLVDEIKNSAASCSLTKPDDDFPMYSVAPTRRANAYALSLSCSSKRFLVFDSQIFTFCNLFSKAFALCLKVEEPAKKGGPYAYKVCPKYAKRSIRSNKNACLRRMTEVVAAYIVSEDPSLAPQYFIKKEHEPLLVAIRAGMELFIVGHEYGHVHQGHLGAAIPARSSGQPPLPENHQHEYEADCAGVMLSIRAMRNRGYPMGLACLGAEMFMSSMMLINAVAKALGGEVEESSTHPPFALRHKWCREVVYLQCESGDERHAVERISDDCHLIMRHFTDAMMERLKSNKHKADFIRGDKEKERPS